ncbi:RidA family protein [Nitrospirillum viridazoti]|uniref:Reactive intermediate/imine deaminase n=1 Tax=Nitrospirillum amazonense TaxID=28077 RepID=A0A560I3U0_9PROT|nr:RidA family protein [Nitrospirillum amazonense]TWB52831.1 reactive intermediate/imine deaminase [Nitrospirillum amazonense]
MRIISLALLGCLLASPALALTAAPPGGPDEGGGATNGTIAASLAGVQFYRPETTRVPYSQVVRVGDILYVSGQLGVNQEGKVAGDVGVQAKAAMDNISAALGRVGSGMGAVFKCTVMLTDMAQWAAFNQVYVSYFKPDRLPARSAMGVSALPLGAGVEVECWAYAPK